MPELSPGVLALLRSTPHRSQLYAAVMAPPDILKARVNEASPPTGDMVLAYDAAEGQPGELLLRDTMTDADGIFLDTAGHVPDYDRVGTGWETNAVPPQIANNKAVGATSGVFKSGVPTGEADIEIVATLTVGSTITGPNEEGGVAFRITSIMLFDYLTLIYSPADHPNEFRLERHTAGPPTVLGQEAFDPGPGQEVELRVICEGDRIRCYRDGSLRFDVTYTPLQANTRHGVYFRSAVGGTRHQIDDLEVRTLGQVADVLPGMSVWVGSTEGARDKGVVRLKAIQGGLTGTIETGYNWVDWADDDYLTVKDEFRLWHKIWSGVGAALVEDASGSGGEAYSDQNDLYKPKANAGPPGVAFLEGGSATLQFVGDRSFAIAPGASLSGDFTLWTAPGSNEGTSTDLGTEAAPVEFTWPSAGIYWVSLQVGDTNGKLHTMRAPVWIIDRDAGIPFYREAVLESAEGDWEAGGWRASLRTLGGAALNDFPEGAQVVVFSESRYGATLTGVGGFPFRSNIRLSGFIATETVLQDAETGEVSFELETINGPMDRLTVWGGNLSWNATPGTWHQLKQMTIDRAIWHILSEHSTLADIADLTLTGDADELGFVDLVEDSIYRQVNDMLASALLGSCLVDRQGRVYVEKNVNLLPVASRTQDTIMSIGQADRAGELEIPDRPSLTLTAQVDFISFTWDGAEVAAVYSLAPENQVAHGRIDRVDGILVDDQAESNLLSGLYYAWRNNAYPRVGVPMSGDWPVFDIAPQEWVNLPLAAGDTQRGIVFASGDRFVPRTVIMDHDPEGGAPLTSLIVERESSGPAGVTGNYPAETPTPGLPPGVPPPPPELPPDQGTGRIVLIGTDDWGMFLTTDVYASPPTWVAVNGGLSGDALKINALALDPFDPANVAYITTQDGIYKNTNWQGGGSWSQVLSHAAAESLFGFDAGTTEFPDIQATIALHNRLYIVVKGDISAVEDAWLGRTDNGGTSWTAGALIRGVGPNPYVENYGEKSIDSFLQNGGMAVSPHDPDKLFIAFASFATIGDRRRLERSDDAGATLVDVASHGGGGTTSSMFPFLPYQGNPTDQILYVTGWGVGGSEILRKSTDGGVTGADITPPGREPRGVRRSGEVQTWSTVLLYVVTEPSGGGEPRISFSTDGGATWTLGGAFPRTGIETMDLSGFPYNERLLMVGLTDSGAQSGVRAEIILSQDRGVTWADKTGNLWTLWGDSASTLVRRVTCVGPDWVTP